jgi:hypothetical protein
MKEYFYAADENNRVTDILEKTEDNKLLYQHYLTCNINESDYEKIKNGDGFWAILNNEVFYFDLTEEEKNNRDLNNKISKIPELKMLLNNTDYQVIKCYEAQLLNEPMPYNLQELLAQRKAWRDEINAIEFELTMLD